MGTPKSGYAPGKHPNSLANLQMLGEGHAVDTEASRRGGYASAEVRKRKRLLRDAFRDILDAPLCGAALDEEKIKALLAAMGVDNPTNADAVALATARKALAGDVEAARFVRDSAGEKPAQGVEIGNIDGRPFSAINLAELSDDQLKELVSARSDEV